MLFLLTLYVAGITLLAVVDCKEQLGSEIYSKIHSYSVDCDSYVESNCSSLSLQQIADMETNSTVSININLSWLQLNETVSFSHL